jgi:hypothetical protein
VNKFIEDCRREWRRLHVPKAVADDMAAELETDLFGQSWAAEQGVKRSSWRKGVVVAVLAVLVCLALVGATLAIFAPSRSATKPVTLVFPPPDGTAKSQIWVRADPTDVQVVSRSELSDDNTRTVGVILLVAGLGGVVAVTAVSLSMGRRQALRF